MELRMRFLIGLAGSSAIFLSACSESATNSAGHIAKLSDNVVQMAAPYQDLTAVRIDPEDGCYVYRHVGPVETTYLPLRTNEGRPICSRKQS